MRIPIAAFSSVACSSEATTALGERPYKIAAALAALLVLLTVAF